MDCNSAYILLRQAYIAEVECRDINYINDVDVNINIKTLANIITTQTYKFGVIICGICGNGKTTLLRALRSATNYLVENNYLDSDMTIRMFDAKDINHIASNIEKFNEIKKMPVLAIEDIGREAAEVVNYGNYINPLVDLLEYRYNERLPTFITTNLTNKEIRDKYGNRIADRFNEMMNVIIFKNNSFRR